MTPVPRFATWLRHPRTRRPAGSSSPRRRRPAVVLRLEELEHRATPSAVNVVPQQFATSEYTAVTLTQSQLLAGDSARAPLQASSPTQPANATLVDNHNGTFTFTPNPGFTGTTTFQYTVGPAGPSHIPQLPFATYFGLSVAINGDTAVVGAPNSFNPGAAYVFVRSGGTWSLQAELTAADGNSHDAFGTSVSLSCDTAVIGAPNTFNPGAAYVFVRSGGTWSQQAKLTASDGAGFFNFGSSVSLNGDTAVIGQPDSVTDNFAAYVFVRSGGTWSQQAKLTASDGIAFGFGSSVSLSGDTAVVGASFGTTSLGLGAAYVFVRSGSTWSQQAELTASDSTAQDNFGSSVSVSGDAAVIGAAHQTVHGNANQGAAYVFVRSGSTWSQQAEFTAADGTASAFFGSSVSLGGDTAVIGAPQTVIGFSHLGAAYVFVRSGSTWSQQAELSATDDTTDGGFGSSVSISGGTTVVGYPGKNLTGAAYEFVRSGGVWTQQGEQPDVVAPATALATVQVNPATAQLAVSPTNLPPGTTGGAYPGPAFTAAGGSGSGYTFRESGLLPPGLAFDPAGARFTGTPLQAGTFPGVVIAASDGHGGSGSQTYTLTVNGDAVPGFPVPFPQTIYAPPTGATEPSANAAAFIRGLYHSVLGRDVEGPSALLYWETIVTAVQTNPQLLGVAAGTDPYSYVSQGFWNSQEHRWRQVERYYHDFLGRDLDPNNGYNRAERQYWANQFLLAGAREADVVRGFLTSAEYLYRHRGDAALADTLNTSLLGGRATPAELQAWAGALGALDARRAALQNQAFATPEAYQAQLSAALAALDDETAQTGVLFDVLGSGEYRQAAVQSLYHAFLQRSGTPDEVQTWLARRGASGSPLDPGTIAAAALASPEYRTNAANSLS